MISIESVESVNRAKKRPTRNYKGRLVRSLEFTSDDKCLSSKRTTTTRKSKQQSMWRDNFLPPSNGFTTHKMSSVTNNFLSSDLINSAAASEIDEMVEDLVDPGSGTLVFPQHDEVYRSSPLSTSSFVSDEVDTIMETTENIEPTESVEYPQNETNFGMSWNQKQNSWIPITYRYVFPSSAFDVKPKPTKFTFPPPQKSIMMGPVKLDSDARDVCEKLLELIDDENLMLPVVKSSSSSQPQQAQVSHPYQQQQHAQITSSPHKQQSIFPSKTLLSEWSSLPSSPPPPIFHDVCNRPIPELRLSPPMTGKSVGKRLFPTTTAQNNSPCESPLTKRLRFSSSSSSIVSQ